jgi:hypothetical protein
MLLAEGGSRPRPERRPAGEGVDHGEGQDDHRAACIGDRRRHRLDECEDLLRRDDRGEGARIGADPELRELIS